MFLAPREKVLRILVAVFKANGNAPVWFSDLYTNVSRECGRYVTSKSVVSVLNTKAVFEVVESLSDETKRWGRRYHLRPEVVVMSTDDIVALVR